MKINKELFFQNLNLTQIYCQREIQNKSKSIARVLRSLNLNYQQKKIFGFVWNEEFKIELTNWNLEILDGHFSVVNELFNQQINKKKEIIHDLSKRKFKGKILVSEFLSTITDGVSEIESKGLIDRYDLPPIDTWFYLTNSFIFAWIPEKFEFEANQAIIVNCLDILSWLNNGDKDLLAKSLGLTK